MPFCIIFFVIINIFTYLFCFKVKDKVAITIVSILGIFSVFMPNFKVFSGVYINPSLFATLIIGLMFCSIFCGFKESVISYFFASIIGLIYFVTISMHDIFLSIDYSLTFPFILISIAIILFGSNIYKGMCIATSCAFLITIAEGVFWWRELQYIELNVINIQNMLCALYVLAITIGYAKSKTRLIKGGTL